MTRRTKFAADLIKETKKKIETDTAKIVGHTAGMCLALVKVLGSDASGPLICQGFAKISAREYSETHVYVALTRLTGDGLITKTGRGRDGSYLLTAEGDAALQATLEQEALYVREVQNVQALVDAYAKEKPPTRDAPDDERST